MSNRLIVVALVILAVVFGLGLQLGPLTLRSDGSTWCLHSRFVMACNFQYDVEARDYDIETHDNDVEAR